MPPAQRVTVFGASGTVGTALVGALTAAGRHVTLSSRAAGIDVTTGAGVARVLAGADVLIDVTNSPVRDSAAAKDFFTFAATTLTDAARTATAGHCVMLSIVGVDGILHLRGKDAGEAVRGLWAGPHDRAHQPVSRIRRHRRRARPRCRGAAAQRDP